MGSHSLSFSLDGKPHKIGFGTTNEADGNASPRMRSSLRAASLHIRGRGGRHIDAIPLHYELTYKSLETSATDEAGEQVETNSARTKSERMAGTSRWQSPFGGVDC